MIPPNTCSLSSQLLKPRSKLEMKVASLLKENKALASDRKPLSVLEKRAMMAMNLQEVGSYGGDSVGVT